MRKEEYEQLKEKSLLTQSHLTEKFKNAISKMNEKYRTELIGYVDKGIYFEANDICGYVMKPIIGEGYYNEKEWQQVKQRLNKEAELQKIMIEALKAMVKQEDTQTPLFAQETNRQAQAKSVGESVDACQKRQPAQIVNYGEYKRQCLLQMRLHQKALLVNIEMANEIKQVLMSGVVLVEDEKYGYRIKTIRQNERYNKFKEEVIKNPAKMKVLNELLKKLRRTIMQIPMWYKSCANTREFCDRMSERCYCSDCRLAAFELEKNIRRKYEINKDKLDKEIHEYFPHKCKTCKMT